ncbi:Hsp20/alpha crystallin family protein [Ktedonobacteria bacterium brp13]|nr:Hsp20/alpha crystallin family protein [Ktedonobacteria bacterium brp13]
MLTRYDPFRETLSLRRAMDQLLEQSFINPRMMAGAPSMAIPMDVCETPNGYEVDVALPGVRPEDIEFTVDQNAITIRGSYTHQNEHQSEPSPSQSQQQDRGQQPQQGRMVRHQAGHNWLLQEISSGSFERTITFPRPIDTNAIQTKFENGILTIQLPISQSSLPKRFNITGGQAQPKQVTSEAGQQQVTSGTGQQQVGQQQG